MPETTELDRVSAALANRYRLVRELGRGGMATVYLAEDTKHARRVAVKVLHPALGQPCCEPDRFLREIHIAARLVHPGILPLHDSGERDGYLYYVMPFVAGETLRQRLRRTGPLPVPDAVRLAQSLAAALEYAHRNDILHRDIKPENVLLHEGSPVLADFGVARAISAAGREGDRTGEGLAVGTPAYMSPEQASGQSELDARSDQYSLACLIYEMLAGSPPFAGGNLQSIMARQVTERPQPIRARRPEVPAALEAALARALDKDPAARFPDVLAFANALTSSDGGAPVSVGPGVAIAVLPFANLSHDPDAAYLSDGITEELISALTQVEGLRVASRTSAFAFKDRAEDVRAIGARLGVTAVLEGSVRQAGRRLRVTARLTSIADGRHLWSERYDRELADVFAIEEEIARTIVRTLRPTLLGPLGDVAPKRYTDNVRAYALYLQGRYAWSTRTLDGVGQAIRYFEQAIDEDPEYALAYAGLADAYTMHIDYRGMPVAAAFERARQLARRALELDDALAEAHTSLAWVLFIHDWDWDAALAHFRRAVALNPGYATAHQWMAFQLLVLGRTVEALSAAQIAIDLDPHSAAIRRALGWLYYYARRWDEAEDQLHRALALNPAAEESRRVLGMVYLQRGAFDQAETAFREALALSEESAYASGGLGVTLTRSGRLGEARSLLAELEARARERYVSPVPFTMLHAALGDREAAFEALARAHRERRGWMVYLRVEPLLDPLRDDPRFAAWLTRMHL